MTYETGLYVTAGVVVAYTLVGGFMAVSMTDFVQGCIMFVSLIMVPAVVISELGGIGASIDALDTINPALFDAFMDASTNETLSVIGIVSLMSWGLATLASHILSFVSWLSVR